MRGVRREDTRLELAVRRAAHRLGFRFRLHRRDLPGSPDLVFPRHRKAVFVHGCFWHGHAGCKYATVPKTRTDWWLAKLRKNAERDARAIDGLAARGWVVTTIWECETRDPDVLSKLVAAFLDKELDAGGNVGEGRFGSKDRACR